MRAASGRAWVLLLVAATALTSTAATVDWQALDKVSTDELLQLYIYALRNVHLRRALPWYSSGDVWSFGRGAFKDSLKLFLDKTGNASTVPPGSACIEWGPWLINRGVFGSNCAQKWSFDYTASAPHVEWENKSLKGSLDDPMLMAHVPLEGFFDAVVCTEVLEHVKSPHIAVVNLKRLLKPGGHLFITIPFIQRYHRGHVSESLDNPLDHYRYTDAGARHLLVDVAGLTPLERYFEGDNMLTLGYLSSLGTNDFKPEDLPAMMITDNNYKLEGSNELYYGTMWLVKNVPRRHNMPPGGGRPATFHVVITGVGRKTIYRTINSLQGQLQADDYVTVIFDGRDDDGVLHNVTKLGQALPCTFNIQLAKHALGFAGHGRRQKVKHLPGDFIIHSDDDNYFLPDAFEHYRKHAVDRNTLYLFQSGHCNSTTLYTWREQQLKLGNIDTGNGVIPSWLNTKSHWGQTYSGDADFYAMAGRLSVKPPVFVPVITTIYTGLGGKCG